MESALEIIVEKHQGFPRVSQSFNITTIDVRCTGLRKYTLKTFLWKKANKIWYFAVGLFWSCSVSMMIMDHQRVLVLMPCWGNQKKLRSCASLWLLMRKFLTVANPFHLSSKESSGLARQSDQVFFSFSFLYLCWGMSTGNVATLMPPQIADPS